MRKRLTLILNLLIIVTLFMSCSKMPWCWGDDKDKGIIKESYSMHDFPMCVEMYVDQHATLIITSQEELESILDSNCLNLPQAGYSTDPPEIDFDEFSLLGQWATGSCETKFIRDVDKDDDKKTIIYSIKVRDCGVCKKERYDANLVLIPKIPAGYSVEFEVND